MNRKMYLFNLLISFLIILSFIRTNIISNDIMILFFGLIIFLFVNKTSKLSNNKKIKRWSFLLSIFFSISFIVGNIVKINLYNYEINIVSEILKVGNFISIIGLSLFFYYFLLFIYHYLVNLDFIKKDNYNTKKLFIIFNVIILIGYSLYFLTHFPGILSSDSLDILRQVVGTRNWSNHHPIFYTLFVKLFYEIGYFIFHSMNGGIAFVSVGQMIILSSIFSKTLIFLYKRSIPILIILIFLLFYAVSPIIGFYSITMWKDVLFGGVFILLIMSIYELCEKYEMSSAKDYLKFIFLSVIFILLRNNAIYIYIFFIPFLIFKLRKQFKQCLISVLSIFIIFLSAKYSVFNMLNVKEAPATEYISIPLQQVARIVVKNGNISDKEYNYINNLMDVEEMKLAYTPFSVDSIKFNTHYHNDVFANNKLMYLNLWKNLVLQNFDIAVESYLCSTIGYWAPTFYYSSIHLFHDPNEFNYEYKNIILPIFYKYTKKLSSVGTSIISIQHSVTLYFWICLIFIGVVSLRKAKRYILCYIPIIGLWLTLLAATPVHSEFRYIFGAFISIPLIISIPYMKRKI